MSASPKPLPYLLSPSQLAVLLSKQPPTASSSRTIPISAAWYLPNHPCTGVKSFASSHIPHSRFFDLDTVVAKSPYPHMLPSPTTFANACTKLDIRRDDTIVVYDTSDLGIFSAPRVAWTFRIFGHPKVHVLNNYKAWVEQGRATESGDPKSMIPEGSSYPVPKLDAARVVSFEELHSLLVDGKRTTQILDARSQGRFEGSAPEPRPGISSGHMPGALSVPFDVLLSSTKEFLPPNELRTVLKKRGVDVDGNTDIICSCGTGVSATVIETALKECGIDNVRVYDGSWTEWAQRVGTEAGMIIKE